MENVLKKITFFKLLKLQLFLFCFGVRVGRQKLLEIIINQQKKGVAKYGKYISECGDGDYDWELMASEEAADLLIYSMKNKKEI